MNIICINNISYESRLTVGKLYGTLPWEYGVSLGNDMYKYNINLSEIDHRPDFSDNWSLAGRTLSITDDTGNNVTVSGGRFRDLSSIREEKLNIILG